jgi:hypothetical protein
MDPMTLAAVAGTALIGAMATDAWAQAKAITVSLWRRVHPERANAVEAELIQVRAEVLAARQAGDTQTEAELAAEWQHRLRRLLIANPSLAGELQRVLRDELIPMLPPPEQACLQTVTMTARASGHGRVYQAGGHQYIAER